MNKIAITNEEGVWFDVDKAEKFEEETYHDGRNWISKATKKQWDHQYLFKTKTGKWVLNNFSNVQGSEDTYEVISSEDAAVWFLKQELELPKELKEFEERYEI